MKSANLNFALKLAEFPSSPYAHVIYLHASVGVYVPVGGKKLLTYLDDLNMPAKDEYGSQPPLELVRQWIDYGFWYDRLKQTTKEIRVRLLYSFSLSR